MRSAILAAAFLTAAPAMASAQPPAVATSIAPLHALAAAVMKGVGEPTLIVKPGASPHTYSLKPSDAKALQQAKLVYWVGPGLEGFLAKPLKTLAGKATAVAVQELDSVRTLPARKGGIWDEDEDGHGHGHGHGHEHEDKRQALDSHLWLDPMNGKAIARRMATDLGQADPANAAAYQANAEALAARLDALDAELVKSLEPVKAKPFLVFHDGYQYFEARYGLTPAGSVAVDPDHAPGAKRVGDLRQRIKAKQVACVFREPQFSPKLVATLVEGTGARVGTLDPIGGSDYEATLRGLAAGLTGCLAQ